MSDLMHPIVNLNGTSRDFLISSRCDLIAALRHVRDMMRDTAPHGRDYPNGGLEDDKAIFLERYKALFQVESDLAKEVAILAEGQTNG